MTTRRTILATGAGLAALAAAGASVLRPRAGSAATDAHFKVEKTDAEWRRTLTPAQYAVLRQHDTERAGSSPLDHEARVGTFACAGCDLAVYRSADKFDSGTGWPSFTQPIQGAVQTSKDDTWIATRTEVHCAQCGGHLGHVFPDGPPPTGQRYCMNGVAMNFHPAVQG